MAECKGMGEEAIQHCRSYALEAKRKMGELLLKTERHPPEPDKRDRSPADTELPPTLAELPKEEFEAVRTGKKENPSGKNQKVFETREKVGAAVGM